jgi:hypothetical protein
MDSPALRFGKMSLSTFAVGCFIEVGLRIMVLTVPAVVASTAGMGDNGLGRAVKIGTVVVVGVGILAMSWGRLIWLFLLGKHLWKQSRLLEQA